MLARIKSTYPIVLEAEEKQIVAIGERPLETQNSLAHRFFDGDEKQVCSGDKEPCGLSVCAHCASSRARRFQGHR